MTAKSTYVPFDDSVPIDPTYLALGASWRRSLLAQNRSPRTLETYLEAHRRFGLFLAQQHFPQQVKRITRAHVELWLIAMQEAGYRPASISNRYRGVQAWFHWLIGDGELTNDPTARIKTPMVPEEHKPILTEAQVTALLKTCDGKTFSDRRDLALLMLLFDTGARREGVATILAERLNLDERIVEVVEKGRRPRVIGFGVKTARVLDRYQRARAGHRFAVLPQFFLGPRGALTGDGLYQIVQKRATRAGLRGIHPHLFRHTYSHMFLEAGGQESDLMAQVGWKSPQMARLYGSALREKRAQEAAKRLSPGDRLGQ